MQFLMKPHYSPEYYSGTVISFCNSSLMMV